MLSFWVKYGGCPKIKNLITPRVYKYYNENNVSDRTREHIAS
jgi:hypothetical protein